MTRKNDPQGELELEEGIALCKKSKYVVGQFAHNAGVNRVHVPWRGTFIEFDREDAAKGQEFIASELRRVTGRK